MTRVIWGAPPRTGPSGEPVARELLLKGDFCNGVHLMQDSSEQQAVDKHNQSCDPALVKERPLGRNSAGKYRSPRSRAPALAAKP